jgi:integrase
MAALRRFDAANLWGTTLSPSAMYRVWRRAVATVRASLKAAAETPGADDDAIAIYELFQNQVPANSRPYDLRHSFATEFLRRTGDRTALQQILQHKDQRMLERYTKGAIPDRVNDAMAAMRAHWAPETVAPPLRLVPKGS